MTIKEEIKAFKAITEKMYETFKNKRHDYGQSTTELFNEFGPITMYIKMYDKMSRFKNLMNNLDNYVKDESILDTLLDLANYALITILEYQKTADRLEVTDEDQIL